VLPVDTIQHGHAANGDRLQWAVQSENRIDTATRAATRTDVFAAKAKRRETSGRAGHSAVGRKRADRPSRLPRGSWPGTLRRTGRELLEDHALQWAAALTFFGLLSLFPAMLALVSVLGLLGSSAVPPLLENISQLAPGTARDVALDALRDIERRQGDAGSATYGSIGSVVVFLVWLWLANIAIVVGAEFNAELERTRAIERGLRAPDNTPFLPLRNRRP
jgi:uncharacterized BrkB/YihY/UPF0761 family membrane protein